MTAKLKIFVSASLFIIGIFAAEFALAQPGESHNLKFKVLVGRWDEAMPLGNGWLGALIWQKENNLRISLDRVDIWDDRPMPEISKLTFDWVVAQVNKGDYGPVQKIGDEPYNANAAPTKIPGAAIAINYAAFGKVISNELDIKTAVNKIEFENGVQLFNYVHAVKNEGFFKFENLPAQKLAGSELEFIPRLVIPNYSGATVNKNDNSHSGGGLQTLGYAQGSLVKTSNSIRYHQPTWNGNYYEVLLQWKMIAAKTMVGSWTISINQKAVLPSIENAAKYANAFATHTAWWKNFWNKSSIKIPDAVLEKQYYLEMYKAGCVARNNTPPISLQAIWTADNGSLPPWKGDIHNDLNTQLSYWPLYSGNHLQEAASFTNWLWNVKEQNKKWTKSYFGIDGLNVPGVTTISGTEMGGWIQYAMSPTTAAWLAQHFYWQWKYSMDKQFLLQKCKPWFDEVYKYFSKILIIDPGTKKYKLPLSSSPEIHDNSINAWFKDWTNYDLALVKSFFNEYIEITKAATGTVPAKIEKERLLLPAFAENSTGLIIAPGENQVESHRHHSPYLAIYPMSLLDIENEKDKITIEHSLAHVQKLGTRQWTGYSFSWMANMYAHAKQADSAANMLKIFATNFCSVNSFHLNGDQRGGQYSAFTYRPFTLEGNFAFAQGLHEMLLQSHKNYIEIFPATPQSWKDASFVNLRAQGAFLVSAKKENGAIEEVKIISEKGGLLRLKLPFKTFYIAGIKKKYLFKDGIVAIQLAAGETVLVKNGFE